MNRHGFTLIEVLLSVILLALIVSIVYAIFSSVTGTVGTTRVLIQEMNFRQFLTRGLEANFTAAYSDKAYEDEIYRFLGTNDEGRDGPQDCIRFCSTASLTGGMTLPGDLKEVRYEFIDRRASSMALDWDDEEEEKPETAILQVTETPMIAANVQGVDEDTGLFETDSEYNSPSWRVPVRSFDVQYYDGTDWVQEWDSLNMGRLPWAVHIRINFAKSEEQLEKEKDKNYDVQDDPDFELIVGLPLGFGVVEDLRSIGSADSMQSGDSAESGDSSEEESSGNQSEYIPDSGQEGSSENQEGVTSRTGSS